MKIFKIVFVIERTAGNWKNYNILENIFNQYLTNHEA